MKTAETINTVCSKLGTTKADLAKRMGMLPSSLYRKLARESMTLEEFQECLDVLGVGLEFDLIYPDGNVHRSQVNQEMLLKRVDMLETEFMDFPVFNLADCFISCGCVLLMVRLAFFNKAIWKDGTK